MEDFKILSDLVKINTIKDKENEKIINYIEKFLSNYKFKTEYKGKYLIMSIGENAKIGFLGHTDTVEYTDGWNTEPLTLTKINNELYGLGACDMKGGIAAMLQAISEMNFNTLKYGMRVYFTYDEEIGFGGVYNIIDSKEKFPTVMIFGETTNNEVYTGSKGLLECELHFNGIKAHASNPEKGKSANLNAIKMLAEFNEFYENNIKKFNQKEFEIPYTTMNIGIIDGGSSKNSVPAHCKVTLDFRLSCKEHSNIINTKLEELSNKYDYKFNIIECKEPFINKLDIVENVKTTNFLTEASCIENVDKIILGPGPVTAHEVNEHITIESYNKTVEQYKILIKKVCNS